MPIIGMPDGTQVEFPDDMPSERIRGLIASRFPDAVKSLQPQQAPSRGPTTVLDYPSIYGEMNRESRDQVGRGIEQIKSGFNFATTPTPEGMSPADQAGAGPVTLAKGVGNVALGGLGYVASPLAAGVRTLVGKPLEEQLGVPKEYSEFAATMALPIPKRIGLPSRAPTKPAVTGETLFEKADEGYAAARSNKFMIASPDEVKTLKNDIISELKEEGYRDFTAGKTFRSLEELNTNAPANISDLDAVRKALNKAAADPAEKDAARRAVSKIDDFLSPRSPEIAQARGDYAAAKRGETLDDQANLARIKSESPTGPTIDTALRQRARAILSNKKLSRGFSEDEKAQLEKINKGIFVGNAAGYISGLLKGTGSMKTILPAATGGMSAVAAKGFDLLAGAITKSQWNKLQEAVAMRSPSGRAVEASARQWTEAVEAFEADPSVKAFVKLSIMSRNLSNTLKTSGVSVEPGSLIRAVQGPVRGTADDEQPEPERVINQ